MFPGNARQLRLITLAGRKEYFMKKQINSVVVRRINNTTNASHSYGVPRIILFPGRTMVYIRYCGNEIFVYLDAPFPDNLPPRVMEIKDDPPPNIWGDSLLIRNGKRHNHIVASFSKKTGQLLILTCGRLFIVEFSSEVNMIHCGGNVYRIKKHTAAA